MRKLLSGGTLSRVAVVSTKLLTDSHASVVQAALVRKNGMRALACRLRGLKALENPVTSPILQVLKPQNCAAFQVRCPPPVPASGL